MFWNCIVLTCWGEEKTASFEGSKSEVLQQLSLKNIQIIEMKFDYKRFFWSMCARKRLSMDTLAALFEDFQNMLAAGLNISQCLLILKQTSENGLTQVLTILEDDLCQGKSLAQSIMETKSFPWIAGITISAGEKTGNILQAVSILSDYFKRSMQVQKRIKQALVYPVIVFVFIFGLMLLISFKIVPQLKNLLPEGSLNNQITQNVLLFSLWIQKYIWFAGIVLLCAVVLIYYWNKRKPLDLQALLYGLPVLGGILKESALGVYFLNLSVLLKSGIPLLKAIEDLGFLDQTLAAKHFSQIRHYIFGGSSFWQSIEQDDFFPRIIPSVLRRAEEMTQLDIYCLSLSEYLFKRVNSRTDDLIRAIQPFLLILGGVFLIIIATAFLMPIYGNLTSIAGGQ